MRCKGEEPKSEANKTTGERFNAYGFEASSLASRASTEGTSATCAGWYSDYQKSLFSNGKASREHIEVFYPESPQTVSDGLIHSRIIFALFVDLDVDDTHIGIRVENGWVTLGGSVKDERQKYRAGNIAMRQAGVRTVRNNLQVASRRLDHRIAENVKAVLESLTLIDTQAVEINVDRGIVMLSGRVPNQNAREAAGQVALRTPGVLDVRNQLNVVVNG
jgi:osmotically-inducible protein OsmY